MKLFTLSERILHLSEAPHMTWKRLHRIWRLDPTFQKPYQVPPSALAAYLSLTPEASQNVYRYIQSTSPNALINKYKRQYIHILTPFHEAYPARLLHIYDPPWVLYALGDLSLLGTKRSMAVVGTRNITSYGIAAMEYLLPPLIKKQVVIVSGLAKGTDTSAHQLAVSYKGRTIAVLGSGFYQIYPKENAHLANTITKHHLLLSEHPPHTPPRRWQFPMRNRIISGLSDLAFIVEADKRSGSLITAYQALEQGREVKVLPGTIFSRYSRGTNLLMEEGASPVLSSDHLWLSRWD